MRYFKNSDISFLIVNKCCRCLIVFFSVLLASCSDDILLKPDHTAWADSTAERFRTMAALKHQAEAVRYIDSVYKAKTDLGIGDYWRKYSVKADYYAKIDFPKAQLLIDSMKAVIKGRELNYKYEYGHTLLVQGHLYMAEKKFQQAFQSYYDGRDFARQNADSCSMSDFSQCLGNIYYNQEAYDKAIAVSKEAYLECNGCITNRYNDFRYRFDLQQQVLNTIGICFEKINKPDSAEIYYLQALDFISKQYKSFPQKAPYMSLARAVVEGNLGGVYAKMKRYAAAVKYMKQSIRSNDRQGYDIEDAQLTKAKLAALYISLNHLKAADSLIGQLHDDLVTGRGKSVAHDLVKGKWLYLKWIFYDKSLNQPEAYRYLRRYKAYTDSLNQDKTDLKNTDLDHAFKVHDQQFQLTLLNKNNQIKTAYLIVAVLLLILAVSVAIIIWYNLKRSRENITAMTRLNNQMTNTLHALESSHAENSRMMAIVAHDLRNPVGNMTNIAGLILDMPGLPAEQRELLEILQASGFNSLDLIGNLLGSNSRLENLTKEPIDIYVLLNYCVSLMNFKAKEKKQQILFESGHITLMLNREKMWRVFSNLIGNAIKFSPENSVISIRAEEKADAVLITVKDNGIGIPDDLKEKIFDMFTVAKRKGTANEQPFGMGLAIVKQVIEAHEGKIWFESKLNIGTTFYVELPKAAEKIK